MSRHAKERPRRIGLDEPLDQRPRPALVARRLETDLGSVQAGDLHGQRADIDSDAQHTTPGQPKAHSLQEECGREARRQLSMASGRVRRHRGYYTTVRQKKPPGEPIGVMGRFAAAERRDLVAGPACLV